MIINPTDLRSDERLTNYAVGFAQPKSILTRAFRVLEVPTDAGKIDVYGAEGFRLLSNDVIGPLTDPWPRRTQTGTTVTFLCQAHGQEEPVPRLRTASLKAREQQRAVRITTRGVELRRDVTALSHVSDAANHSGRTATPSAKFNSSGTDVADYLRTIKAAIEDEGTGPPDSALLGRDVANAILANTVFVDWHKYTRGPIPPLQSAEEAALSAYLGLDCIIVNTAYLSAGTDLAPTLTRTWPAESMLVYVRGDGAGQNGVGFELMDEGSPAYGALLLCTGYDAAPQGIGSYSIPDQRPGFGAELVRSYMVYDLLFGLSGGRRLLTNVLA